MKIHGGFSAQRVIKDNRQERRKARWTSRTKP